MMIPPWQATAGNMLNFNGLFVYDTSKLQEC